MFILGHHWPTIAFEAEDGTGSGTDTGNDEGGAPEEKGNGAEATLYRPDGLDEAFHGETDQETIDKLMAGIKDAKPQLPEDVSGYDFTPAEGLEGYFSEKDDPLLNSAKAAALKNGIAPNVLQSFINDTFGDPVAKGVIAPPFNPKAEIDGLAKMLGGDTKVAEKAINDADAIAGNLAKTMGLPEAAAGFFEGMAETASGVMVIRAIQKMAGEKGIALGGQDAGATTHFSRETLKSMGADPRIDPQSPKYDPDVRKKYDDSYRALYGG
nr:hypothetical protein [uncultured Cohaesibacter sp.]